MKWRKLGLVFKPDGRTAWMRTHASNPVAEPLAGDVCRVYFSGRDAENRSSIGWVELDLRRPQEILRVSKTPVVSPGPRGSFDQDGASMGCLVKDGTRTLLYYLGWNVGANGEWRNTIGLAKRDVPVLGLGKADPFSLSYPWVMREGKRFLMWYGSHLSSASGEEMKHALRFARSKDGVRWERDGAVVVNLRKGETGISRPCVLREKGLYRMWYSFRGETYRIGYGESKDGIRWRRRDELAGIGPSASGWDGEAVCYPCVFDQRARRYMLYNGNGYGRTGFGLAVLED